MTPHEHSLASAHPRSTLARNARGERGSRRWSGRPGRDRRETHPDVVIMNLQMPGLDGFEAAAAIRQAVTESPPRALRAVANGWR